MTTPLSGRTSFDRRETLVFPYSTVTPGFAGLSSPLSSAFYVLFCLREDQERISSTVHDLFAKYLTFLFTDCYSSPSFERKPLCILSSLSPSSTLLFELSNACYVVRVLNILQTFLTHTTFSFDSLEANCGISSQEVDSFLSSSWRRRSTNDDDSNDGSDNDDPVLEKAVEIALDKVLEQPEAAYILLTLSRFDDVLIDCLESLDALPLTSYLFHLSHTISKGLKVMHIKTEDDSRKAILRLMIFLSARRVLESGLKILGLTPLKAM